MKFRANKTQRLAKMTNPYQSASPRTACFITMPTEILTKILSFACTHSETIMPEQFAPGLAKFSLRLDPTLPLVPGSCPALTRHRGALPQELSAFDITRTCHMMHELVDGDHIFYANNHFEFSNQQALLKYLVALPSSRRNAIRSIKVKYDYHGIPAAAFLMLTVCYGLNHLSLDIMGMTNFFVPYLTHFSQAPGYPQLMALKGLKSLKLIHEHQGWSLIDDILARIRVLGFQTTKLSLRELFLQRFSRLSGKSVQSLLRDDHDDHWSVVLSWLLRWMKPTLSFEGTP